MNSVWFMHSQCFGRAVGCQQQKVLHPNDPTIPLRTLWHGNWPVFVLRVSEETLVTSQLFSLSGSLPWRSTDSTLTLLFASAQSTHASYRWRRASLIFSAQCLNISLVCAQILCSDRRCISDYSCSFLLNINGSN